MSKRAKKERFHGKLLNTALKKFEKGGGHMDQASVTISKVKLVAPF